MTGGVDTVSFAWRPESLGVMDALLEQPHRSGAAGGVILAERGAGDERVMAWPAHGLVVTEGRLGAMLAGTADNHDLVAGAELDRGAASAATTVAAVLDRAVDLGRTEVRRFDLARELWFDDRADGLAFLRTLSGMCPPRARTTVERSADGQDMTVYVRTPKRGVVLQRFYDKGLESGSHPPGHRIRLEAQMRPAKSQRQTPEVLATTDLRSHFIGRMRSYVEQADSVVAAGSEAAVDHLAGMVAREELSTAKAERMLGSLVMLRHFGRAAYNEQQGQRRLKDLRRAGVALEHELPPDRVVPVGELLRDAMEDFRA